MSYDLLEGPSKGRRKIGCEDRGWIELAQVLNIGGLYYQPSGTFDFRCQTKREQTPPVAYKAQYSVFNVN
jgi:hypothetical protein